VLALLSRPYDPMWRARFVAGEPSADGPAEAAAGE